MGGGGMNVTQYRWTDLLYRARASCFRRGLGGLGPTTELRGRGRGVGCLRADQYKYVPISF